MSMYMGLSQTTHIRESAPIRARSKGRMEKELPRELASYLPAAEILEEEVERSCPHHGSGHDAEEWQGEDPL